MEAKDTVMSDEKIGAIRLNHEEYNKLAKEMENYKPEVFKGLYFNDNASRITKRNIALAQSEISFPLGKQEGIKEVGELLARRAGLVKGIAPISSKGILTNLELETLRSGEMIEKRQ